MLDFADQKYDLTVLELINSEEEMIAAKEECREEWEEGYRRECFELEFPIEFLMPDGSIIVLENESNLRDYRLGFQMADKGERF